MALSLFLRSFSESVGLNEMMYIDRPTRPPSSTLADDDGEGEKGSRRSKRREQYNDSESESDLDELDSFLDNLPSEASVSSSIAVDATDIISSSGDNSSPSLTHVNPISEGQSGTFLVSLGKEKAIIFY